jgi:hypothetical protein
MSAERIEKYEEWIRELEARKGNLASARRLYFRVFIGAIFVSVLGFFKSPWFGVGAILTGIMFCVCGFYMVLVRSDEYDRELRRNREELEKLLESGPDAAAPGDPAASERTVASGGRTAER